MDAPAALALNLIYPRQDGRPVIKARVAVLTESLRALGLRTPISVRPSLQYRNGQPVNAFEIVAGRHRYEAARSLGWEAIDAFVKEEDGDDAELWEIDENFARAELTDAQRADGHARRERILVAKGIVHSGQGRPKKETNLASYSENAAAALGVSETTIKRELARGKKIDPDILAEVTGTDLDKGVVLDELAKTPREDQRAKLAELTLRRAEADRVRREAEGANRSTDRVIALTEAQQFADWLMVRTDLHELPTIISWLQGTKPADVISALRREAA